MLPPLQLRVGYRSIMTGRPRGTRASTAVKTKTATKAGCVLKGFGAIVPADADVSAVAETIVKVVDAPFGKRPFRVHIDPTQDGAEVVTGVLDRVRAEMLRRIGLSDVLKPRDSTAEVKSAA
jgi:hypothetical protein